MLNIGLVVGGKSPFHINGAPLDGSGMFVTPPGAQIDLLSPAGGTILAICIETDDLSSWSERHGEVDPISIISNGADIHKVPDLAQSLRGSAMGILKSALSTDADDAATPGGHSVGEHFLSVVLSQFSLHRALGLFDQGKCGTADSVLFEHARTLMLSKPDNELDYSEMCVKLGCSSRTIQQAFARHTDMSPTRYLRTVRLNKVRRMLLSGKHAGVSIGDLAARCGFWNWSRFSRSYKQQFGELPSETRLRTH